MLELIKKRFIDSFDKKEYNDIGVEIELQLVNTKNDMIDVYACHQYLESLSDLGFTPISYTEDSFLHCVVNSVGDKVSFDSSYNILEFSMQHTEDTIQVKRSFEKLYRYAVDFFSNYGYFLSGLGINPYFPRMVSPPVNSHIFGAIDAFLTDSGTPNLFQHVSSTQIHHDCKQNEIYTILNLLSKLDFVNLYLFANAPDLVHLKNIDLRDSMYRNSKLTSCGLTGVNNSLYTSNDDVLNDYAGRYVFFHSKDTEWQLIDPVPLVAYLEKYPDNADDFVTFRNVEITEYGTVEQRGIPTQPVSSLFVPVLFQKGIMLSYQKASDIIDEFILFNGIQLSNSQLRLVAETGEPPPGVSRERLCKMFVLLTELASESLKAVGLGEEKLLEPLFVRAESFNNPAKKLLNMLSSGVDMEIILREYGDLDAKVF